MMDAFVSPNSYYQKLEEHYQLSPEQALALVRVVVGLGLRYLIESVKADAPDAKINRVVKDEVREAANISISSLDKYLGEAFRSERTIDQSTLDKLSRHLFYQDGHASDLFFSMAKPKYLKPQHIGFLGNYSDAQGSEQFIVRLIAFIKSSPAIMTFLKDNLNRTEHSEMITRVFELKESMRVEPQTPNFAYQRFEGAPSLQANDINPRTAFIVALSASVLGVFFPVYIVIVSSAESAIVWDYVVHNPGKHIMHVLLLPCMLWAFLRCLSLEQLKTQKKLFLVLIASGALTSIAQTYVQDSQSICQLMISSYPCSDITEKLFSDARLASMHYLYNSFLSFIGGFFATIILSSQLLEIRNRNSEICSPLVYALINVSYIVWVNLRSYSEWHEVALSFDNRVLNDFEVYRYESTLMILSMLIISQILVLYQLRKRREIIRFLFLFAFLDFISLYIATNIHHIASKFHSFTHSKFEDFDQVSTIFGPLIYWYSFAVLVIFLYVVIVNKTGLAGAKHQ